MFWTTFAGGMIRILDTPEIYRWLYDISFMKHAVQGVLHSVYGFNRTVLPCPDDVVRNLNVFKIKKL